MVAGEIIVEDMPWSVFQRDPLTALIDAQQGVVARWQASRFLSPKAVRHRIDSQRWRRVHHSVYLTYGGPITLAQRHWIAVLAASGPSVMATAPACLGGLSALRVHGLRSIDSSRVHVLIPAARRALAPDGVVIHRSREFTADDRHPVARPPSTTVARAVVDAAVWARSDNEARMIIAASFQQRLVTAAEIGPVLDRLQNVPRHRLIVMTVNDASAARTPWASSRCWRSAAQRSCRCRPVSSGSAIWPGGFASSTRFSIPGRSR